MFSSIVLSLSIKPKLFSSLYFTRASNNILSTSLEAFSSLFKVPLIILFISFASFSASCLPDCSLIVSAISCDIEVSKSVRTGSSCKSSLS